MKRLVLLAFLLASLTATAFGQQGATRPPQTSPSAPQTLPKGKIAVINTDVIQEKVLEYRARIDSLNRQFEPEVKDLQGIGERAQALQTTIETQGGVLGPAKVAELSEQLDRMKRDYQRKKEDLEAKASRAREVALKPVNDKLSKFAADYTARKGVVVLFDLGNAFEASALVWYDSRIDLTQDFINEYNKANPAPSAPAPNR
jgi:Skp family chaperone for outer membrane proteins